MKIGYLSDLHLEFRAPWEIEVLKEMLIRQISSVKPDLVLDVGDGSDARTTQVRGDLWKEVSAALNFEMQYAYVHGNHDPYHGQFFPVEYNFSVGRDFVPVHCGTLWTNFQEDPLAEIVAQKGIMDFHAVKVGDRKLLTSDVKKVFYDTLREFDKVKAPIIGTHFPPTQASIHPRFRTEKDQIINKYFVNDLEEWILDRPYIKLWVHGHVHDPHDYWVGNCHVVCNPLGYPKEREVRDYTIKFVDVDV